MEIIPRALIPNKTLREIKSHEILARVKQKLTIGLFLRRPAICCGGGTTWRPTLSFPNRSQSWQRIARVVLVVFQAQDFGSKNMWICLLAEHHSSFNSSGLPNVISGLSVTLPVTPFTHQTWWISTLCFSKIRENKHQIYLGQRLPIPSCTPTKMRVQSSHKYYIPTNPITSWEWFPGTQILRASVI